jgi:hypothetical protein
VRVCTRCGLTRLDGWKVTFFFLHMPCRKNFTCLVEKKNLHMQSMPV